MSTYQSPADATTGKLVPATPWTDLTSLIVAGIAGGLTTDPGAIAGTLTATASTGTFNGETVDCVQYGWTTTGTQRDGSTEASTKDLGTILALFPQYNPAVHALQLVADIVAISTLNGARPLICLLAAPAGSIPANGYGVGWHVATTTNAQAATFQTIISTSFFAGLNPTTTLARTHFRSIPLLGTAAGTNYRANCTICGILEAPSTVALDQDSWTTATDKLFLTIGQATNAVGALSGLKIRHRVRLLSCSPNLLLGDLTLGCQL